MTHSVALVTDPRQHRSRQRSLQAKLGYKFRNHELLRQALTHESVHGEPNYQNLEFFGDSVLYLVIPMLLREKYPGSDESKLTRMRGVLVTNANLASIALQLNVFPLVRFGSKKNVRSDKKLLADIVEALIGAVHEDGGLEAATAVCRKLFAEDLQIASYDYPIEKLATFLERAGRGRAKFMIMPKTGRHQPSGYVSTVRINGHVVADAHAFEAANAVEKAAAKALAKEFPG